MKDPMNAGYVAERIQEQPFVQEAVKVGASAIIVVKKRGRSGPDSHQTASMYALFEETGWICTVYHPQDEGDIQVFVPAVRE